ncbi:MAG: ABC transporter permease [Elusimicrobiota bacterium]
MSARGGRASAFAALYGKELRAYFDTPTAYVITTVMVVISGYFFATPLFLQNQAVMSGFIHMAPLLLLFFIPAITMRLYAEELKSGTIEILSTLPVHDEDVLAAKFLAALTLVSFMLAGTLLYPLTLERLGDPDWGAILGSYAALLLMSAVYTAAGAWASSLTRNQVIAFIVAFLINFTLFLLGKIGDFLPDAVIGAASYLGLDVHIDRLSRGVLDTRDIIYFASLTGFFLYLTYLNAQLRRQKG